MFRRTRLEPQTVWNASLDHASPHVVGHGQADRVAPLETSSLRGPWY
jgi:hypothetical protein